VENGRFLFELNLNFAALLAGAKGFFYIILA
jgi:hypothetical protein